MDVQAGPESVATTLDKSEPPGLGEIFVGFLTVGLCGFGGIFYWLRRIVVERRRWLTAEEFAEYYGLCSLSPGPGLINLSVLIGKRFHGAAGGLAAFMGLLCVPVAIALCLAAVYAHFQYLATVRAVLSGVAAAAAGLVIATAAKMLVPLFKPHVRWGLVVAVPVFAAVGIFRLPLLWALAFSAPLGLALAWWKHR
ncbi:MAG TPA: chromate transporter [Beijerinckiaceae bacterium]|nr:chromate transporter [Beijerinckiaceae bacterium]